ncbi:hypothetical protein J2W96_006521 [Variovorax guangxiensis]|nr:hypothetical protein [Variovorax guangxiensis]
MEGVVDAQEEARCQIDAAFGQHPVGLPNVALAGSDLNAGRLASYHFQQRRQKHELRRVAHVELEATLAAGRVEGLAGCKRTLDLGKTRLNRTGQFQRERRGRHARTAFHEERVVERRSQALERSAHRRLAHAGLFCSERYAARAQQRVEGATFVLLVTFVKTVKTLHEVHDEYFIKRRFKQRAPCRPRASRAAYSHPDVQKWLERHPRFVMHFTPTSASWLNMVERFFRDITDKRIRRDSFTSVLELELAIDLYVAHHNIDPKPFIWTARACDILAKVTRAKAA